MIATFQTLLTLIFSECVENTKKGRECYIFTAVIVLMKLSVVQPEIAFISPFPQSYFIDKTLCATFCGPCLLEEEIEIP